MPEPDQPIDTDFDAELRGLVVEAEQARDDRAAAARKEEEVFAHRQAEDRALRTSVKNIQQTLHGLTGALGAVTRSTENNTAILSKLDKLAEGAEEAQSSMPQMVADLQSLLDQKNGVNQRMFDALHEELKSYKDSFLLETVQKPIIRDLITFYDHLIEIHRQMRETVTEAAKSDGQSPVLNRLKTMEMNIEHNCEFIVEVLARLEVTILPIGTGKLDKHKQRAVAVEIAEDPDEDLNVARTIKRGFMWKERVVRAEEVVLRKWKEGFLVALAGGEDPK